MALLETIDLCQAYEKKNILKNISLTAEKGEILAIIGPTGAGKTTLLRLLNTLEKPSSGRILMNGNDITHSSKPERLELRRKMAFVLQKPTVFNMSVFDNVAIALKWRGAGRAEIEQKTTALLEAIDLAEYRDRNARTLSGGETQRVAIARAVITRPEILLLDEPGANLDPQTAMKVEEFLSEFIRKNGVTTVMSTHDMSQAQRMADKVAVMMNGEILQTGNWNDVFTMPETREIAYFVGVENIIDGKITSVYDGLVGIEAGNHTIEAVSSLPQDTKVHVFIRPEDITIATSRTTTSARNSFAGTITRTVSFGALTRITVDCGFPLIVLVTGRSAGELGLVKGKEVYASFKATAIHVTEIR